MKPFESTESPIPRFADWYEQGPHGCFLIERRSGGTTGIAGLLTAHHAGHYTNPPTDDLVVGLNVGGRAVPLEFDAGAGRCRTVLPPDGFLLVAPLERFDITLDARDRVLMTTIPTSLLCRTLDTNLRNLNGTLEPLLRSHHVDPFVSTAVHRVWREMDEADEPSRLFVDGTALAMIGALRRISGSPRSSRPKVLSDSDLTRLVDAIDDRLDADISLNWLADLIGWQSSHLGPAFKNRLGRSPYQYVLERRVRRACRLLETTHMRIAEIAYACGFSSQQHMTAVFTRKIGVPPAKYRRSVER